MKKLLALFLFIAIGVNAQLSSGPGTAILIAYTNLNANQFVIVGNEITLKSAALITNAVLRGVAVGDGSGLTNFTQSRPTDPGNIWYTNNALTYLNTANGITGVAINETDSKTTALWVNGNTALNGTNVSANPSLDLYGPKDLGADGIATNRVFVANDASGVPLFTIFNDGNVNGNIRSSTNYATTNLVGFLPVASYPASGLTTNINVIIAGTTTNQLQFTRGVLTGVVPQ